MGSVAGSAGTGRLGVMIDVDRCVGCYNCFLACRDEHVGNEYPGIAAPQAPVGKPWIRLREVEQGSFPHVKLSYVPLMCLHCADAPCMDANGNGALYRRPDGIVILDPEKAVGRRDLVASCPYGAISWNEEANVAQKCTLCAHLLDDGWAKPRCVEACPTDALVFGDLDDPSSAIATLRREREPEELRPDLDLGPAVGYFGLPRRFVRGDVAFADRPAEPAAGIAIRLETPTGELRMTTDHFGDFTFSGLSEDSAYRLVVEHPGYAPVEVAVAADETDSVGTIELAPERRGCSPEPNELARVVEPGTGLAFYELSHVWGYNTPAVPGYPDVSLTRLTTHAQHGVLSTHVVTVMHTGTHVNAPAHLLPRAPHVGELPLQAFFGNGVVVGVPKAMWELVGVEELERAVPTIRPHDIVLINTGWHCRYADSREYFGHGPGLSVEAAEWLAALPVKLVGVDMAFVDLPLATSMGPQRNGPKIKYLLQEYRDETGREAKDDFPDWNPAHRTLLGAGIPTIENVGGDLDSVTGMRCTFQALPWPWREGDACVVRLVAILDPGGGYRLESGAQGDE